MAHSIRGGGGGQWVRQVDQQEIGQRATSGLPSFTPRPTSTQYPEPGTSAQYPATILVTKGQYMLLGTLRLTLALRPQALPKMTTNAHF